METLNGNLLTTARSPWGESVFTHISWSLFWASLVGGLLFLLAHGGYMLFSQHHKRDRPKKSIGWSVSAQACPLTSRATASWRARSTG